MKSIRAYMEAPEDTTEGPASEPAADTATDEEVPEKKPRRKGKVIACDFDSTLSHYTNYKGVGVYGDPIPEMVTRIKEHLDDGDEVVIFTARAEDAEEIDLIGKWCEEHIGKVLEVTNKKDPLFDIMYDDRAIRVEKNTGRLI